MNNNPIYILDPYLKTELSIAGNKAFPPEDVDIKILFQSSRFLVVDKPFELKIDLKSDCVTKEVNLMDLLLKKTKIPKLYPLHQLDKVTSGIMVYGLDRNSARFGSKQFKDRKVTKIYEALVHGHVDLDITIEIKIGKLFTKGIVMGIDPEGKECVTICKTIKKGFLVGKIPVTLVELQPYTGRTHQLRVTMQHIGSPIVGDWLYAGDQYPSTYRMMLHARKLCFPFSADLKELETPSRFKDLITDL